MSPDGAQQVRAVRGQGHQHVIVIVGASLPHLDNAIHTRSPLKNILYPLYFLQYSFLYSFTSIFNYSLFYIILYNYHILFLLFNNNIVNINYKS
jgi:hypothetical protein